MFIFVSLWGVVGYFPSAPRLLPWKEERIIDYLSRNCLVMKAALKRAKCIPKFIEALVIGDKKPDAETFKNEKDTARFLKRISDLAKERNFEEARTIGSATAIEGSFENFRNYSSLIVTAYEENASVTEEIYNPEKNIYRIRIKAKRFIDPENKKSDELVLENGYLVEVNGFPIKLKP